MTARIEIIRGDITQQNVDAIVNTANTSLMGGSGVDGAIHRAGGPAILEECRAIVARQGKCPAGEAVITTGGLLPARFVIHTVGPVWNGGKKKEAMVLSSCYRNSLQLAAAHAVDSIAFPNISTGVYRFPKPEAADIALATVREMLSQLESIDRLLFVCFDEENYNLYSARLNS
ncbi:MAG: O-acetyl-ADP-ribose deacetylase [Chitinophagaceae bacterium]|nr:O-acetyl-ADP-ribose deacetylase [Chitinophagaceae bacterium]